MTFTITFGFWTLPAIFTACLWIACYRVNAGMPDTHGLFAAISVALSIVATLAAWSTYFAARLYGGLPQ